MREAAIRDAIAVECGLMFHTPVRRGVPALHGIPVAALHSFGLAGRESEREGEA